jgi:hypothetical protein
MPPEISSMTFVKRIFQNLEQADRNEIEALYHDIKGAAVILPSGKGRSKGAPSVACSEIVQIEPGKRVLRESSEISAAGFDIYHRLSVVLVNLDAVSKIAQKSWELDSGSTAKSQLLLHRLASH